MGGPRIAFYLRGGELVLSAENIYQKAGDGVGYLNFKGFNHLVTIFWTVAQANFMVTYDLQRVRICFKKMMPFETKMMDELSLCSVKRLTL